ncbi:MAG: P-II family nitrogen regulator [Rhodothermia bacterium]
MKEIKAYIRPTMLDQVVDALLKHGDFPGVTVSTIEGFGHPKGGGPGELMKRVKLEIVVLDHQAEEVLQVIVDNARTGSFGDGKIFVSEVGDAVRIRTGDRGDSAVLDPNTLP